MMSTRYDVYANGALDNGTLHDRAHAGLCGALAHARTQATEREGVRFVVMRSDQRGPAVEVGRYRRVGTKLTAWVL